jgi:uncharacterized membrane protein
MELTGWEAFGHGVFAIAVTLLVLDIKVPAIETVASGAALVDALLEQVPHYAAYVIGFVCIGTYWINVHRSMRMLQGVDHGYIVIGLLFLLVISAIPFVTALLAEYLDQDNGRDQVALVVFTGWQLLLALLAYSNIRYAVSRRATLIRPEIPEATLRRTLRITAFGPLIWLGALVTAALANSTITLVLITVVFALFLFEPPAPDEPPANVG